MYCSHTYNTCFGRSTAQSTNSSAIFCHSSVVDDKESLVSNAQGHRCLLPFRRSNFITSGPIPTDVVAIPKWRQTIHGRWSVTDSGSQVTASITQIKVQHYNDNRQLFMYTRWLNFTPSLINCLRL